MMFPRFSARLHLPPCFLAGVLLCSGASFLRMAVRGVLPVSLAAAGVFLAPAPAEARRFGGMRSFGFRGSRGFSGRRLGGFSFGSRSRRSLFRRGFRRRPYRGYGFGLPFFGGFGFPFFGFGFGLFRFFMIPLILFFVLRLLR